MRRNQRTRSIPLLALRAAWDQAGHATRREWLREIVGGLVFDGPAASSGQARRAPGGSDEAISRYLGQRSRKSLGGRVQAAVLLADYNFWAKANGAGIQTAAALGRALRRLGLRRLHSHKIFYLDIQLIGGGN